MFAFEKRWAEAMLAAYAPPESEHSAPAGLAPRNGEVRYLPVMERMMRASNWKAAFALRAALWLAVLAPVWCWGKITLGPRLPVERRAALLAELLRHRYFVVRELALLLKLAAAFALFGVRAIRERSGYDRKRAVDDSGVA